VRYDVHVEGVDVKGVTLKGCRSSPPAFMEGDGQSTRQARKDDMDR
jgi:hypothetical protein